MLEKLKSKTNRQAEDSKSTRQNTKSSQVYLYSTFYIVYIDTMCFECREVNRNQTYNKNKNRNRNQTNNKNKNKNSPVSSRSLLPDCLQTIQLGVGGLLLPLRR